MYRYDDGTVAFNARNCVKTHSDAYDRTSLFYFLLEETAEANVGSNWKKMFGYKSDNWSTARSTIPYSNSDLYKIADSFKVEAENIPCIIFFRNIEEKDAIIWPVSNSWFDGMFYDLDIFISATQAHRFTKSGKFTGT